MDDHQRLQFSLQPVPHDRLIRLAFGLQMTLAQPSVQCLQRRRNALCIRPGAGQIRQRQTPSLSHRIDSAQQHAAVQRLHGTEQVAQ